MVMVPGFPRAARNGKLQCTSSFQSSVYIMYTAVPLATACHMAKTSIMVKSVGAEKHEPLQVTAVAIHCSRHEMYAL